MKRALVFCAVYSGCVGILRRAGIRARGTAAIMGYHGVGVAPDYAGRPGMPVVAGIAPAEFERQVRWLARKCNLVSAMDIIEHIRCGRAMPPYSVALIFDDGYENVYSHAFPILQRYSTPATVFLTTSYIGKHKLFLSWEQVSEMHRSGISFGAHTVSHPYLTRLPLDEARSEITRSKAEIEDALGGPVQCFCYPHGNLNEQVKRLVVEAGFRGAMSTRQGLNNRRTDPFALNRIRAGNNGPFYLFRAREAGLSLPFRDRTTEWRLSDTGNGLWQLTL